MTPERTLNIISSNLTHIIRLQLEGLQTGSEFLQSIAKKNAHHLISNELEDLQTQQERDFVEKVLSTL